MKKTTYLTLLLLIACGGKSDPLLTTAKLELKGKRQETAYQKLSEGLYSPEGKNKNLKSIPEAWFHMGKLHGAKDEFSKMQSAFSTIKSLESKGKEKTYTTWFDNHLKIEANKHYNASVKSYQSAYSLSDESKKTKHYKDALNQIHKAIGFMDKIGYYYSLRGQIKEVLKEDGIVADYTKALDLDPKDFNTTKLIGFYYFNSNKYKLAAEKLDEAAKKDTSNNMDIIKYRSYAYQNSQQYDKAVDSYNDWKEKDPKNASILASLTPLYYQMENFNKAIEIGKTVIENNPDCDKSQYTYLANSYFSIINELNKEKKMKDAKLLAKECLAILNKGTDTDTHKENGDIWKYKSYLHAQLGQKKLADKANKMAKKFGTE